MTPAIPQLDTMADYLDHWTAERPDEIAVIYDDEPTSYAALRDHVTQVARALLAAGIGRGDRVAVLSHPNPICWLTFLATLSIGGVWLGLNPRYRLPELQHHVDDSRPTLLIGLATDGTEDFTGTLRELGAGRGVRTVVFGADAAPGLEAWSDFLAGGADIADTDAIAARAQVCAADPALIVYTSGSTGSPKGAVLSQGGITASFLIEARLVEVDRVRTIANLPINHIGGIGDLCCTPLISGGTIIFQDQFDPTAMIQAAARHRVTILMQVPTTLKYLVMHPALTSGALDSVRYIWWGGGPLPLEVVRTLASLGVELGTTYGMTELTGSVSYSAPGSSEEVLATTVGVVIDEVTMRIVDEHDQPVADGEPGEILVKHPGMLLGYFGNEQATAESITADGFFRTGDVGYLRPDGNLVLVARTKEIFKSGGYNTFPREIELALEEHPAVTLAAVVATPHPVYDEVGVAYLEVSDPSVTPETITAWVRERLANYKVPKAVVIVPALPLLPVGKVDKVALRELAAREIAPQWAAS